MKEKEKNSKNQKKQSMFYRIFNLEGILFAGKYIMQLILLYVAISFMIGWFLYSAPESLMESRVFIIVIMAAIMLMPVWICYKNMDELGEDFPKWILIGGVIILLFFYFLPRSLF